MTCKPEFLRSVPLFALLDDDETAVLASQVELKTFSPRERIYKMGGPGGQAYVMITGKVRVSTVDEDGQEVVVDEPSAGEFFGFASMLEQTPHHTNAIALEAIARMAYGTLALGGTEPLEPHILAKHHERKHGSRAYYGQLPRP